MRSPAEKAPEIESQTQKRFPENLPAGWRNILQDEAHKPYFKLLTQFLKTEYGSKRKIYPPREKVLRALQMIDYHDVRVVILGQDPYHGAHQAIGLCFAVPDSLSPKPPSLGNIFKEMEKDIADFKWDRKSSELTGWAEQGVFLLNTVLTVRANEAFSHRNQGWETFTDRIISLLSDRNDPIVFLLWGAAAQKKKELINAARHTILAAAHPSPLSAHNGFFGCQHFSKVNTILTQKYQTTPIDWSRINAK